MVGAAAREHDFESEVVAEMVSAAGWVEGDPSEVDLGLGLNPVEVLRFVEETQPEAWARLAPHYGGVEKARVGFVAVVAKQVERRGVVDVLRNGVKDRGQHLRLAFFKPAHGITSALVERYERNRLVVCRQQRFRADAGDTLDLCLFVNGLPVATVELKNRLTGQTVADAVAQYRQDRPAGVSPLLRAAVVHFAVDQFLVEMTPSLAGESTVFLPFNRGDGGRAGNPEPGDGWHRTSYLWRQVWQRDAWLDLLHRFVNDNQPRLKKGEQRRVVFPRFHQWDCVLALEADARAHGPGKRYLAEHSAGSGKSNSIAWLAYRLTDLHNAHDERVFDKVVVITDRVVLDDQLQATIAGFDHPKGFIASIERKGQGSKSERLAAALQSEQARIVVCTLQTFSFVLDKVDGLAARNYAVIVDEAHSSQTGEAAKDLKAVLGAAGDDETALAAAEKADTASAPPDPQDALADAVAARGQQPNLSYFAFTATPKARTLELFGTEVGENEERRMVPFHSYSMRQAIEEGFILDVLANYTTYDTMWRIEKAVADDPEVDSAKASAAIARYVALHPHMLDQKARVIVDHYRSKVAHRIGGLAKAMVVTASRLHAVRYKQAIDRYLDSAHINDVHALVAFSGTVMDTGVDFTEPSMNGFPESETGARFRGDDPHDPGDYQVMIVAEKFQTGFDAPLLHTMYVDKPLSGVAAVQTLARLNRTAPGKSECFVLDFRNDADVIREAFRPFYDRTEAIPTDPGKLYEAEAALRATGLYTDDDLDTYWAAYTAGRDTSSNAALYAALDPAVTRYNTELDDDEKSVAVAALDGFVRIYSFLSQVVSFGDETLETTYVFAKGLRSVVKTPPEGALDLGSEVQLTHLRLGAPTTSNASLADDTDPADPLESFTGTDRAAPEPQTAHLSEIVEKVNERHGLNLSLEDALLFDQFTADWLSDPGLRDQARNNSRDNFAHAFNKVFFSTILARMTANDDLFKAINDDDEFADTLFEYFLDRIYTTIQTDSDDT